ncbi:hypothetical protein BaRGS_00012100 [Batillaria attramentaria]|uniref:Uncharacterized protein n=1 Tax=Batillaria attramentaria TaxID=370345 RepID=A0ABD0LBQ0_9CAEN
MHPWEASQTQFAASSSTCSCGRGPPLKDDPNLHAARPQSVGITGEAVAANKAGGCITVRSQHAFPSFSIVRVSFKPTSVHFLVHDDFISHRQLLDISSYG